MTLIMYLDKWENSKDKYGFIIYYHGKSKGSLTVQHLSPLEAIASRSQHLLNSLMHTVQQPVRQIVLVVPQDHLLPTSRFLIHLWVKGDEQSNAPYLSTQCHWTMVMKQNMLAGTIYCLVTKPNCFHVNVVWLDPYQVLLSAS